MDEDRATGPDDFLLSSDGGAFRWKATLEAPIAPCPVSEVFGLREEALQIVSRTLPSFDPVILMSSGSAERRVRELLASLEAVHEESRSRIQRSATITNDEARSAFVWVLALRSFMDDMDGLRPSADLAIVAGKHLRCYTDAEERLESCPEYASSTCLDLLRVITVAELFAEPSWKKVEDEAQAYAIRWCEVQGIEDFDPGGVLL